jgi:hypothetical protein
MYLRRSTRTYKGKTYTNYVLVESVLTLKGPRQRTVCSLGDLKPRPHKEWLALARKLKNALTGQADLLQPADPVLNRFVDKTRSRKPAPALGKSDVTPSPSEAHGASLPSIRAE